ncbi:disulfide bond formation protein DsbB [Aliiglaciecola sp. CAU 1673]|uniref:disulfide bond formation protein DsbB n=1 Tax=Aliiglaciecola sp. CAU 1673 TaxID=3032595 RepID=UPI0023DAA200|nr:disulfide bond formation protein DsbB [Aliiglaciecola sp. CAU 1673]MDF2179534.1 disulfide bond formation protein DsbB [Aliiglaciecola sp. CAU 1673]
MNFFSHMADWPTKRWPWLMLMLSALFLEISALYFQYGMNLKPCIMCIYQRNAVFGLLLAGLVGMFLHAYGVGRFIAFSLWAVSAVWGLLIANEHLDIQTAANPFFTVCEIVPNFPSWLPLHEWIPAVFAATGDCGDIDWSFMDMSMPAWMQVIFAVYSALLAVVLIARLARHRSI